MQLDGRARIVEFWRAVEMLNPNTVPKLERRRGAEAEQQVFDLGTNDTTPWSAGHPLTADPLPPHKTWQFTVYGGIYDLASIQRTLAEAFGDDSTPTEGRSSGRSALFAFAVDIDGFMVENSGTLSACAWALGRLGSLGPDAQNWLDGFHAEERAFKSGLNRLAPPSSDLKPATSLGKAARRVGEHAKGAAVDAAGEGAKATGAVVTATAAAAIGTLAGPVVGGIAGAVAGTFVEKLLTPGKRTAPPTSDGEPRPRTPRFLLTAAALHEFAAELAAGLGVTDLLSPHGIRIQCARVPTRDSGEAGGDQAFLNSFIADDLARVGRAVVRGDIGIGLQRYLADTVSIPVTGRVDVRERPQAVIDGVEPTRLPPGRWPGDVAKPLVLSQQFAVDRIMTELETNAGVFAVNGPPGTGKTTLLRDVIAAIVVGRARGLSSLVKPADAFTDEIERVKINERSKMIVRDLAPTLTGAEILVATSGNTAAANVTAEIPGIGAVDGAEEAATEADYFSALASHVLGAPAWGLLAATLGNRRNCGEFVKRFWWGDEAGRARATVDGSPPAKDILGMQQILYRARDEPDSVEDWTTAVNRFRAAEADVVRLSAERSHVAQALRERPRLRAQLQAADETLARLMHDESASTHKAAEARHNQAGAAAALRNATEAHQEHRADQPGFWVSLSTLFRAGREWEAEHRRLKGLRDDAEQVFQNWHATLHELASESEAINAQIQEHTIRRGQAETALSSINAKIAGAQERWPNFLPDLSALPSDCDDLQLCAPWADAEFTAARNRVTLEALRLHKAFILGAATLVRHNLTVAVTALNGNTTISDKALLAVWRTLFMTVPVISTTFASLPRLFGRLGREALGWLFVDEAGQATPQQVLGGIWRAQRTVIVGDPQQLEPIVTLPSTAQRALLKRYGVAEEWLPDATSAQRVADRLNNYGTLLRDPIGDGSTWVGAPLRVHRRCDRPMFEISNQIAYGGTLMVFGTAARAKYHGRNRWIDVPSDHSSGNWVPAEGEALRRLLDEIAASGVKPSDIRLTSPFLDVIRGSKRVARGRFGEHFARDNIGTVHTMQGQEADVVVLVLGSAPGSEGARRWAAEKPNLLNVAVSRAKRRLYVIGDLRRWRDQRHFNVLAAALPASIDAPEPALDALR
ncbi:DEAD/DEAH box helicase [Pseudonocardia xinjiangensis]|uniref:DEAD/DEAH box helicase n=1 Tax=Pseudonocardia xinjiangensis TaxID=75289 RepID=UPI003D8F0CC9